MLEQSKLLLAELAINKKLETIMWKYAWKSEDPSEYFSAAWELIIDNIENFKIQDTEVTYDDLIKGINNNQSKEVKKVFNQLIKYLRTIIIYRTPDKIKYAHLPIYDYLDLEVPDEEIHESNYLHFLRNDLMKHLTPEQQFYYQQILDGKEPDKTPRNRTLKKAIIKKAQEIYDSNNA
jgi:hypothetical protein